MITLVRVAGCAALLLLAACARTPVLDPVAGGAARIELDQVPFFPQSDYQCGPAALATVLGAVGVVADPEQLVAAVYLPERKGSLQVELVAAARRYGRVPYPIDPDLAGLLDTVRAGHPVLVLQNLGVERWPLWHFAVVIGFDAKRDEFILRSGTTRREVSSATRFLRTWQRAGNWGLVVLPPGELPPDADRERYLRAVTDMEGVAPPEALRAAFAAALTRWPDDSWALVGLGNAHYGAGDARAAEAVFRAVLAQDPAHPVARNNLAQLLGERGCRAVALDILDLGLAQLPSAAREREQLAATRAELLASAPVPEPGDCPPAATSGGVD
ncbi:MAG: PA2778 family cysteine peptidase [Porticoccaceae bacterium]